MADRVWSQMRLMLRRGLVALVLLALSQLLFWAMVTLAERQARPADLSSRDFVEFQVLDAAGEPLRGGERFRALYQGTSGYRTDAIPEGETDQFSVLFVVKDPTEQLALFMAIRENLREVKVNAITVQPDVPLQELQGAVTSEPAYFPLPMNVLQPGYNVLTISKDHEGLSTALPEFAIGPAAELAEAYRWKSRYLVDLPLAGIAILAFTIALCLAVNWPREDQTRMRWLVAFLASYMLFTVSTSFVPQAGSLAVNLGLVIAFQLAISAAMAKYVAHDIAAPAWVHRLGTWLWSLGAAAICILFAASLLHEPWFEDWVSFSVYAAMALLAAFCLPCIVALCWACAGNLRGRVLERMIVVICLSTFAIDRLSTFADFTSPFDPDLPISLYWSPIVGALLGLGMILALARQASEARRTVVQANQILATRLDEQDAALAQSYAAQAQMRERQVALEERQRIVRDMHDGIGGQLLGLMMQVRSGSAPQRVVEEGLQSSMADLRLIVDSMDTSDEGLAPTMRSFEHRVRPMVEAAGIAFAVTHGLPEDTASPGPRPSLQILRLLQEAVTNAVRHAGASRITLDSCLHDSDQTLTFTVADNGSGIARDASMGRGIANMRGRAASLGGSLTIDTDSTGTRVILTVPVPGPVPA